jgi:MFS transporter, putative metabolite:H+ symporter
MNQASVGARLDRLPLLPFHYKVFWLLGAGMFFDGYDLYVGTNVLGATVQSGFSTLAQNAQFISLSYFGLTIGSFLAGFIGDKYGRRFIFQFNLVIFGLSSIAAAFAPDMTTLNLIRFVMGIGLGAEIVVGYSTLTEFVPPKYRGRWLSFMALIVVSGLPATAILGGLIIPAFGWRPMFIIVGVGALIVWYLRKNLPESPRWLEVHGRLDEANAIVLQAEKEAEAKGPLATPVPAKPAINLGFASLFTKALLPRLIVGSVVLITVNTLVAGFVLWLPTFFVQQGLSIARSFSYLVVLAAGSILGCAIGAYVSDKYGRRPSIIGASLLTILFGAIYPFTSTPATLLTVGFLLIVSIYIQVAMLFGVYTTELFPTEVRLRGNGVCNTVGRAATIVSPYVVVALFQDYGIFGVIGLLIILLIMQIIAIATLGVEPAGLGLEEVDAQAVKA